MRSQLKLVPKVEIGPKIYQWKTDLSLLRIYWCFVVYYLLVSETYFYFPIVKFPELTVEEGIQKFKLFQHFGNNYNFMIYNFFSSVQFSHSAMSDSLQTHGLQHDRPSCPSPTPRVYSNSGPLSKWCHPTISFSVVPFSSHPKSFPESGSFQTS